MNPIVENPIVSNNLFDIRENLEQWGKFGRTPKQAKLKNAEGQAIGHITYYPQKGKYHTWLQLGNQYDGVHFDGSAVGVDRMLNTIAPGYTVQFGLRFGEF